MKPLALLRALTPLDWLLALAAGLGLLMIVGHGLGLRWDPFDLTRRRLEAAESRAEIARADAAARTLEVDGAEAQARWLDHYVQRTVAVEQATAVAAEQARSAHDASMPLDPDRAVRLRDHDRRLCELSPVVCNSTPPDVAAGGDDALPS